jgi:hypothetical protein
MDLNGDRNNTRWLVLWWFEYSTDTWKWTSDKDRSLGTQVCLTHVPALHHGTNKTAFANSFGVPTYNGQNWLSKLLVGMRTVPLNRALMCHMHTLGTIPGFPTRSSEVIVIKSDSNSPIVNYYKLYKPRQTVFSNYTVMPHVTICPSKQHQTYGFRQFKPITS